MDDSEKVTYICMNHKESWIFQTIKSPPICPKCKTEDCVCVYSGDKKPQRENGGN